MIDWWTEHGPPVYMAVASYLQLTKKKTKKNQKPSDLRELVKMFPGGMIN